MAFKREGNDGSWLHSLQNRRVAELFAEDIPEGEAHLMKNGRFACMVCSHRPIFDTVMMLAQHRKGKKHAAYREIQDAEKEDLRQLRMRRQHEQLIQSGQISTSLLELKTTSSGLSNTKRLLGAAPYNPRHKRSRNSRRDMIDLSGEGVGDSPQTMTDISKEDCLINDTSEARLVKPDTHSSITQSSFHTNHTQHHNPINPLTGKKIYATSKINRRPEVSAAQQRQNLSVQVKLQNTEPKDEEILTNFRPYQRKKRTEPTTTVSHINDKNLSVQSKDTSSELGLGSTPHHCQSSSANVLKDPKPIFIKEFRSGYKKDKFGKWIRDTDAEFDTDDDDS